MGGLPIVFYFVIEGSRFWKSVAKTIFAPMFWRKKNYFDIKMINFS